MNVNELGIFEAMLDRLELMKNHAEQQTELLKEHNSRLYQVFLALEGLRTDLKNANGPATSSMVSEVRRSKGR